MSERRIPRRSGECRTCLPATPDWIELDEAPVWNDTGDRPYSVADYPMAIRLPHYFEGPGGSRENKRIRRAAVQHALHLASSECVERSRGGIGPKVFAVIAAVKERETQTAGRLSLHADESMRLLRKHLKLLQTLDIMSLWICIQSFGESPFESNDPYWQMFGSTEDRFRHDGFGIRWSTAMRPIF